MKPFTRSPSLSVTAEAAPVTLSRSPERKPSSSAPSSPAASSTAEAAFWAFSMVASIDA